MVSLNGFAGGRDEMVVTDNSSPWPRGNLWGEGNAGHT
jgi:hypothetical protein